MEHPVSHAGYRQYLVVGGRIEIDGNEYVLLHAGDLGVVHVFAHFPPPLFDGEIGPVFLELVKHPVTHAGHQEYLLVRGRIQVNRNKHLRIERGGLIAAHVLRDQRIQFDHVRKGSGFHHHVRKLRGHSRQHGQFVASGEVGIQDRQY